MTWNSIVAGVDGSLEGIRAAVQATQLAKAAGVKCTLVHAVSDPWIATAFGPPDLSIPVNPEELRRLVLESARTLLAACLAGHVPQSAIDQMDVRIGPSPVVIEEAAEEHDADVVVLGGKHHSAIGRWLAGSTVHHMVRRLDRPLLVVGGTQDQGAMPFKRVLAAVDLSRASVPTLDTAQAFARLARASLRVLHVLEPLPLVPELPSSLEGDLFQRAETEFEESIWPRVTVAGADRMLRRGPAAPTIAEVAAEWDADLIVVGSHGRGWVDRMLIGSVTERLLNTLPASTLVVPVSAPASPTARRPATKSTRRPARAGR